MGILTPIITWSRRYGWRSLALACAYWAVGWLGTLLAMPPGYATAVFPASGIALAALLFFPGNTAVNPAWAVDSRKVEKMIEDSLPAKEQALSAEKRNEILEAGKAFYRKFCRRVRARLQTPV